MKKILAPLALSALTLTGCGNNAPPTPESYETMEALQEAAAEAGLECEWDPPGAVLPSRVAAYRVCVDPHGARNAAVLFHSDADQQARLDTYRNDEGWARAYPAALIGNRWTIECPSASACSPWKDAMGGRLVEAPDY